MADIMIDVREVSRDFRLALPPGTEKGIRQWPRARSDIFRALDRVSFSVHRGEVVGLIGRNGAGKSTLLKILSRVLRPTRGEIDIYGRLGSLLEVGSGFHPDLSGRENIYLNGALLGMRRSVVDGLKDEILAFAGIGTFADEPIKHYSSGMYLRLAFAIAVHLDAEILLLDEVMAVGDEEFRRKCLTRIEEACRSGRTVLIAGHDLATLSTLCQRFLLLDYGRVAADETPENVTAHYLRLINAPSDRAV